MGRLFFTFNTGECAKITSFPDEYLPFIENKIDEAIKQLNRESARVLACADHGTWYANVTDINPRCPICGEEPSDDFGVIP